MNAMQAQRLKQHVGFLAASLKNLIEAENIRKIEDRTFGMARTEVRCSLCEAHLGHVFDDGPRPTGLRFCMNAVALRFIARAHQS